MRNFTGRVVGLLALVAMLSPVAPVAAAPVYLGHFDGNDSLANLNSFLGSLDPAQGPISQYLQKIECAGLTCEEVDLGNAGGGATGLAGLEFQVHSAGTSGWWKYLDDVDVNNDKWAVEYVTLKAGTNVFVYQMLPPVFASSTQYDWSTAHVVECQSGGGGAKGKGKSGTSSTTTECQANGLSHISWWGLQGPSTDVPEPATLTLLGLGLLGAGAARRRAKK